MRWRGGTLLTAVLLAGLALLPARELRAAPAVITLEGIDKVTALQQADTNGDGVLDLLVLSDRSLRVFGIEPGKGLGASARHRWTVPENVSFVVGPSAGKRAQQGEQITWLGTDGLRLVGSSEEAPAAGTPEARFLKAARAARLGWRDEGKATFATFDRGAQGWVIPAQDGWLHETGLHLPLRRARRVKAPGPFLEDTCVVEDGLPQVFVGADPASKSERSSVALWGIADRKLIASGAAGRVAYDIAFLGAGDGGEFDQTLVDLDDDGRPEILHRIFSNRQVHYGFFQTKAVGDAGPPSHKPANCRLSLQGFQLDPEFIDLDGDGRKDLIITSMLVNAANMIGALSKGKIIAETRAFLNKSASGAAYFVATPDATIKSEIGVKVRFNYAGNVEVVRTLMIVPGGDFDGDGRKDLAIRTGPDAVTIRLGRAAGVWASDEDARLVSIPPMAGSVDVEGSAADLDGDGKDELILVYRGPEGGKDIVRIVKP